MTHNLKLPPTFVRDCLECECDIGWYEKGWLSASNAQLAELKNRAELYAGEGAPDLAYPGLVRSARATLAAIERQT